MKKILILIMAVFIFILAGCGQNNEAKDKRKCAK